jgi:hypothetical protein
MSAPTTMDTDGVIWSPQSTRFQTRFEDPSSSRHQNHCNGIQQPRGPVHGTHIAKPDRNELAKRQQ